MPQVMLINPSRRRRAKRKGHKRRKVTRVKRNPIGFGAVKKRRRRSRRNHAKRRTYRMKRNPIGGMLDQVMPAAIGAGGALVTDLALGYLPIPASMQSGMMRGVVRAGLALAMGFGVGMITSKRTGREAMAGALTVVAYDTLKTALQSAVPTLPLADVAAFPSIGWDDTTGGGIAGLGAPLMDGDDLAGAFMDDSDLSGAFVDYGE